MQNRAIYTGDPVAGILRGIPDVFSGAKGEVKTINGTTYFYPETWGGRRFVCSPYDVKVRILNAATARPE